jgi:FMN phosphatase YigB (HAD superfamily)
MRSQHNDDRRLAPQGGGQPRALLLDVMSTLVHEPFVDELPSHFSMTLDQLKSSVSHRNWVAFELGEIDEDTFARRFFRDQRPLDYPRLIDVLRSSYRYLDGVEDLLVELRRTDVPMHALSNYPCWFRLIEDKLVLSRFLEWSFVSCCTGLRKPDPRSFSTAARALGLPPAACVFVDDREQNCAAARATGMDAVHFTDAERLRADLVSRGLLPADG